MKAYLTFLSPFLLISFFLFKCLPLLFSGGAFHWVLIFLFLFSGVAFYRPLISLSFFLSTSSNHFVFSSSSRGQSTNKVDTWFLAFFWRPFNLPIWAGLWGAVYSLHHRQVCLLGDLLANWLVWFFLFADSTLLLPRIAWASWPIGIQPSNRLLVTRDCLPVHTPIFGKLDGQLVSTNPWKEFNSSDFSFSSVSLRRRWERGESIFTSKIWIWLSPGSKFITILTSTQLYICFAGLIFPKTYKCEIGYVYLLRIPGRFPNFDSLLRNLSRPWWACLLRV